MPSYKTKQKRIKVNIKNQSTLKKHSLMRIVRAPLECNNFTGNHRKHEKKNHIPISKRGLKSYIYEINSYQNLNILEAQSDKAR